MFTKIFNYTLFILIAALFALSEKNTYADESFGHGSLVLPRAPQIHFTFETAARVRPINNTAIQFYLSLVRENPQVLLNEQRIPLIHRNRILARLSEQELANFEQLIELRQVIQNYRATRR